MASSLTFLSSYPFSSLPFLNTLATYGSSTGEAIFPFVRVNAGIASFLSLGKTRQNYFSPLTHLLPLLRHLSLLFLPIPGLYHLIIVLLERMMLANIRAALPFPLAARLAPHISLYLLALTAAWVS